MEKIRINSAGIDIGAKKVFTSVEGQPVVSHLTFTEDFYDLRDYLLGHKVETAAMEATGVYWVILYEIGSSGKGQSLGQKRKAIRHHRPNVKNLGPNLLNIFGGKDATVISGITDYTWMQLLAETGSDLTRWPGEKHYTSWLGLSPGQHNSGKMRRNAKRKGNPKAGQIFRVIAQGLINSNNVAIGAFGRRLRGRKGPKVAIKAMARKLVVLYWRVMVKGIDYAEKGVQIYEEQLLLNKMKTVKRLAKELNLEVADIQLAT